MRVWSLKPKRGNWKSWRKTLLCQHFHTPSPKEGIERITVKGKYKHTWNASPKEGIERASPIHKSEWDNRPSPKEGIERSKPHILWLRLLLHKPKRGNWKWTTVSPWPAIQPSQAQKRELKAAMRWEQCLTRHVSSPKEGIERRRENSRVAEWLVLVKPKRGNWKLWINSFKS